MISYIEDTKPPRRRLRIRSKKRLTVFPLIILLVLLLIFIPKIGTSQVNYKPYTVGYGDTYWDIAKQLQTQGYKPRGDIREIVDELIRTSSIPAHELREGDTIYIPEFGD